MNQIANIIALIVPALILLTIDFTVNDMKLTIVAEGGFLSDLYSVITLGVVSYASIALPLYFILHTHILLAIIIGIIAQVTTVALYTDVLYLLVNRFVLRFAYIQTFAFTLLLIIQSEGIKKTYGIFITSFLFLVFGVMFFLVKSIGASDMRMLMVISSPMVLIWGNTAAIIFSIMLAVSGFYLKALQLKAKSKIPVPLVQAFGLVSLVLLIVPIVFNMKPVFL